MNFVGFTTKVSKVPIFLFFDHMVPLLDAFRKFTSIRKPIGSGLKRVTTGSVSKRYQTSLFAQKNLLENVNVGV